MLLLIKINLITETCNQRGISLCFKPCYALKCLLCGEVNDARLLSTPVFKKIYRCLMGNIKSLCPREATVKTVHFILTRLCHVTHLLIILCFASTVLQLIHCGRPSQIDSTTNEFTYST